MIPKYRVWDKTDKEMYLVDVINFNRGEFESIGDGITFLREADEVILIRPRMMSHNSLRTSAGLGAGQGDDEEVAQPGQQVLEEATGIVPGGDDPVDHPEDTGAVGRRDGVDALVEHGGVGVAQ